MSILECNDCIIVSIVVSVLGGARERCVSFERGDCGIKEDSRAANCCRQCHAQYFDRVAGVSWAFLLQIVKRNVLKNPETCSASADSFIWSTGGGVILVRAIS